jgi:uncharacterized protein (UPF0332 family)
MSLQSWLDNHWLRAHEPSPREIANLLAIADRDIHDSQSTQISPGWRLDIAYNAILQCATAALAAAGYQAERQNKHMRTIHSLAFTLGLDAGTLSTLDKFRTKRHTAVYEHVGAVSDQEAKEAIALAKTLRADVERWIRRNHPRLLDLK